MDDTGKGTGGMADKSDHRDLYERIGSVETRTAAHEAELRAIRETMQSISSTVQRMDQRLMEGWQGLRQEMERAVNQVRPQKGQWIGVASLAIASVGVVGLFIAMNREQMAVVEERQFHMARQVAAREALMEAHNSWDQIETRNLRDDIERMRERHGQYERSGWTSEDQRSYRSSIDAQIDRMIDQIDALQAESSQGGQHGKGE